MVEFKTVTLADKAWVDEIVMNENSRSADYNFGNIYIWDKHYRQLVCRCGDRMLTKLRYEGKPTFVFPIGTGPLRPAVEAIREFARFKGYPMTLRGITEAHREMLDKEYPGAFEYSGLYLFRRKALHLFRQGSAREEEPLQPLRGGARLGLCPADARAYSRLPRYAEHVDGGELRPSRRQHPL